MQAQVFRGIMIPFLGTAFGSACVLFMNPVIILLPGTCCHWKANFEKVFPFLAEDFRVVCVSYDGFDETEKTIFSDMVTETEK